MEQTIGTYVCGSEAETESAGEVLARTIEEKEGEGIRGTFVAMYGELGAGKTAFVRGMARVLSPCSTVRSPTYTVVNEYGRGKVPLYHFDLYRITDDDDLYSVGYYDYIDRGVCVAEWSENAQGALPSPRYEVKIDKTGENTRSIAVSYIG